MEALESFYRDQRRIFHGQITPSAIHIIYNKKTHIESAKVGSLSPSKVTFVFPDLFGSSDPQKHPFDFIKYDHSTSKHVYFDHSKQISLYSPPEVISGSRPSKSPQCDIYSLGLVLFSCITTDIPFLISSVAAVDILKNIGDLSNSVMKLFEMHHSSCIPSANGRVFDIINQHELLMGPDPTNSENNILNLLLASVIDQMTRYNASERVHFRFIKGQFSMIRKLAHPPSFPRDSETSTAQKPDKESKTITSPRIQDSHFPTISQNSSFLTPSLDSTVGNVPTSPSPSSTDFLTTINSNIKKRKKRKKGEEEEEEKKEEKGQFDAVIHPLALSSASPAVNTILTQKIVEEHAKEQHKPSQQSIFGQKQQPDQEQAAVSMVSSGDLPFFRFFHDDPILFPINGPLSSINISIEKLENNYHDELSFDCEFFCAKDPTDSSSSSSSSSSSHSVEYNIRKHSPELISIKAQLWKFLSSSSNIPCSVSLCIFLDIEKLESVVDHFPTESDLQLTIKELSEILSVYFDETI
ncbi:hypothetical protein ADUPG1_010148, partial [Aduncisulcus paluster]